MTCHHVGKETDHQCKRLREDTYKLNHRDKRCRICLQEQWHLRPEYLLPVLLVAVEVHGYHRTDGKEERYVDVTRHITTTREYRNKSYKVRGEDEEEHRHKVWSIAAIVSLTYKCLCHIVVNHHHKHLHASYEATRSLLFAVMLLIPASA